MRWCFVKRTKMSSGNWTVEVHTLPNWFERVVLRMTSEIRQFYGSGTVWHDVHTGSRLGTYGECIIADFMTRQDAREDAPISA